MQRDQSVGVRELKTHLSRYLKRIGAGAALTITDRGRPVARLVPYREAILDRAMELAEAGLVTWNGQRLQETCPTVSPVGDASVADMLLEDRG